MIFAIDIDDYSMYSSIMAPTESFTIYFYSGQVPTAKILKNLRMELDLEGKSCTTNTKFRNIAEIVT